MKNTKLAIAIPTFERAETVDANIRSLIPEIKDYSIPIYISDNSPDNKTEEVGYELKKHYEFLFCYKNTIDLGHDKNSFYVVQLPETDRIWLLGDSISLEEGYMFYSV
jgi:hypothetical protein